MNKLKHFIKEILGEENTAKLKKALPTIRLVKNIVCWTLIVLFTLAIITFMITRISGGTPSFFGYSLHRIVSGSMEPELEINEVILNKDIGDASEIAVGDIVTFQGGEKFGNHEVTHRVLSAPYENTSGDTVIVTKGDANDVDDGEIDVRNVKSKNIAKLPLIKNIYNFFFSVWGLALFIFLLLLIFIDEIINIFKLSSARVEQEEPESFMETMKRIEHEEREKEKRIVKSRKMKKVKKRKKR